METLLGILTFLLAMAAVTLLVVLLRRKAALDPEPLRPQFETVITENRRIEQAMREEFLRQREEEGRNAGTLREEMSGRLEAGLTTLLARQNEERQSLETRLDAFRTTLEGRLQLLGENSDQRLARLRQELNEAANQTRQELRQTLGEFQTAIRQAQAQNTTQQGERLTDFAQRLDRINLTLEARLNELQAKNEAKLEEMRRTVDEKLQSTLEQRLGESFRMVSDNLERVVKSLGEMQQIAAGVGDLKRVLTNVKTRGTWGEIQLGMLLEQTMTVEQYAANVATNPASNDRVEFAIRLPGRDEANSVVWLPIDSKFPQEDYQRLVEASERADAQGVADAGKALENRIRAQAVEVRDKYIAPPHTTDFAVLFLPTEGLYAEVLRRPGLADSLQREQRVVLAGPTTLSALLNSLQMGFRTLAIEKRSSEVWKVLGAVKTEFGRFGEVLARVKKKIDEASEHINQTETRTRAINRKLREVEALPAPESEPLLPPGEAGDDTVEPVETRLV
ncbi:MAG: DNA recombination protein RmuC [Verrucomicrobia bacterium]|nr:DNA recombination protein RmuC [Verrucomicrobiota bacterium]